jgi:hypothetical protein
MGLVSKGVTTLISVFVCGLLVTWLVAGVFQQGATETLDGSYNPTAGAKTEYGGWGRKAASGSQGASRAND